MQDVSNALMHYMYWYLEKKYLGSCPATHRVWGRRDMHCSRNAEQNQWQELQCCRSTCVEQSVIILM